MCLDTHIQYIGNMVCWIHECAGCMRKLLKQHILALVLATESSYASQSLTDFGYMYYKVKVKLSLCLTTVIKHYAMKTYRGVDV
jgi:hypothetical protein